MCQFYIYNLVYVIDISEFKSCKILMTSGRNFDKHTAWWFHRRYFLFSLGHESTTSNHDLPMIIGLSLGLGIVLMVVAFVVITVANRKFYTRNIRENAHSVGSVVTEHSSTTNNLDRTPEPYVSYCSASEATESSIYMLASSCR